MANGGDDDFKTGCGCLFFVVLIVGAIVSSINGCRDEKRSRDLRPDYSSRPSEEGRFQPGVGTLHAQGFKVYDGIGYLTLGNGHTVKMWRNKYGEYEGRFDGHTYTATKTIDGYQVKRSK